jgi:hypothetical protein
MWAMLGLSFGEDYVCQFGDVTLRG